MSQVSRFTLACHIIVSVVWNCFLGWSSKFVLASFNFLYINHDGTYRILCDRTFPCASCKVSQPFFNESTWWSFELLNSLQETRLYWNLSWWYALFKVLSPKFQLYWQSEKGVLVSGKGTRFILANTEQLHSKMSDHIRNLEDALQAIHSENASHPDHQQPHPLMQPALLGIKSTIIGSLQCTGTNSSESS